MPKERPTHLCSLEIDPRDPSAIIQAQADQIEKLKEDLHAERERFGELLQWAWHKDECPCIDDDPEDPDHDLICTCGLNAFLNP